MIAKQSHEEMLQHLVIDLTHFANRLRLSGVRISPWNATSGWITGSMNDEMWAYHCGLARILMVLSVLNIGVRAVEEVDE